VPYPYQDDFGRAINYLRVSVTDRCNLRCVYCMPAGGIDKQAHGEILRYEEIALVVRASAELGVRKVRLTGGNRWHGWACQTWCGCWPPYPASTTWR